MSDETEIDALVQRIRAAMVEGGVTAAELARRAEVSEGYVSQLLNSTTTSGRRKLGAVLALAYALGVVRVAGEDR